MSVAVAVALLLLLKGQLDLAVGNDGRHAAGRPRVAFAFFDVVIASDDVGLHLHVFQLRHPTPAA
jgi:hypothetical protein